MARNLLLVLFAVATLLHGSAAQTRHMVGDATGWIIPAGGAATYTTWASNKTFTVNDTLVFNFATGQHNVAKVTKSAFDATVTLNETGEQYYICSVGSHCSAGQKLAINVNRASSTGPSPAPQPRGSGSPPRASPVPTQAPQASSPTPPPRSAPAPAFGPSSEPATFIVGETAGWIVPGNASFYTAWASGKNFRVGDVLVFNYASNTHNVEEVTKANFDACSSASPIATFTTPPARVTLNKSGQHFFICGIPGHCLGGQKLAINVTGSSNARPPPPLLLALLQPVLSLLPHRTLVLHLLELLEYLPPCFQLPPLFSIRYSTRLF
ncbi:Stellacyanin [Glycine soja]|uniref:Stellacyanin n=1 Tax=Glycine soja TaxID=3848 RepID=A0A0B2QQE7_GLYSO|nr:Stellacyanin [Glycine soja]